VAGRYQTPEALADLLLLAYCKHLLGLDHCKMDLASLGGIGMVIMGLSPPGAILE
jgi:hypothetical protein